VQGATTLDLERLWEGARDDVTRSVRSPAQRRWLTSTRPVGFSDDTLVLAAPHSFAREWLDTRCGEELREVLSHAAGRQLNVVITVQPKASWHVFDPKVFWWRLAGPDREHPLLVARLQLFEVSQDLACVLGELLGTRKLPVEVALEHPRDPADRRAGGNLVQGSSALPRTRVAVQAVRPAARRTDGCLGNPRIRARSRKSGRRGLRSERAP
jgi:hypothetical protein